jgi:hypothetical protein
MGVQIDRVETETRGKATITRSVWTYDKAPTEHIVFVAVKGHDQEHYIHIKSSDETMAKITFKILVKSEVYG